MAKMSGFKVYKGTKETFISSGKATANADAIVFITGGTDGEKKSCIFAQGTYFASITEMMKAINFVKGISVEGQSYNAVAGGGYVDFGAKDPSTVAVNAGSNGVEIGLTTKFVDKVNDTATNLGSKTDAASSTGSAFARIANLAAIVGQLTGGELESVEGQITNAINALRTEIVGTLGTGDSKTIQAINDELDSIGTSISGINTKYNALEPRVKTIEDDYLKGADKTALANRIANEAPVTISEAAGSGDILKTYTFTQNGKAIGTINLAKELVVTGGDIVEIDGVKNLQLTIANQTAPVNIPVNELVDAYTAKQNATQVQVAISNANEISAEVVAGSISATELAANAVTTEKIADKNVTLDKLAEHIQTKINGATQGYEIITAELNASNTNLENTTFKTNPYSSVNYAYSANKKLPVLYLNNTYVKGYIVLAKESTYDIWHGHAVDTTENLIINVTIASHSSSITVDSYYTKPSTGIPKTDLASAVQTSLTAADNAAPKSTVYTKDEVDAMWAWEEL
jgi:hypothetical protein